jgi:Tol biopolymer transport system component
MKSPRRLTLDNGGISDINGWTPDSQAILFSSDRNGKSAVFRQGLNENVPEAVVEGPAENSNVGISPDGSWLLYEESPHTESSPPPSTPSRLIRRPVGGGPPEVVLEEPAGMSWSYWCSVKRGASCVLSEREGKAFVFYALDPARGKGRELGKIEVEETFDNWRLSPDGSRLAVIDPQHLGRVEVLTLSDRVWHEISIDPAFGKLQSICWAADEKGLFLTSWLPESYNLLHATLAGKVSPLLRNGHRQWMVNPIPSPDGKYLAYQGQTNDENVWMLENF